MPGLNRTEPASAVREAEKANIPFVAALAGALRRCSSLVWLATRRSERLALHPASAPKNGILAISASLKDCGAMPISEVFALPLTCLSACRYNRAPTKIPGNPNREASQKETI